MSDLPIIVPTHKQKLEKVEKTRLEINRVMNPLVIFVIPERFASSFQKVNGISDCVVTFPDYWFKTSASYSRLLLSSDFWRHFTRFEKVLLCQTDALLLKPTKALSSVDYVFLGAPWNKPKKCVLLDRQIYVDYRKHFYKASIPLTVGNGGLSLRNPSAAIEVITRANHEGLITSNVDRQVNEDIVFSFLFKIYGYPVPSPNLAASYFLEEHAIGLTEVPDIYGFHALNRFNPALEKVILESLPNSSYSA